MEVTWTYRAKDSLKEIVEYLSERDIDAARKVHQRLLDKIELLISTPFLGVPFEMNIRRLSLGDFPYSIYYRVEKQQIQILRIRHEMRVPPKEIH